MTRHTYLQHLPRYATMSVGQLIDHLKCFDPNKPVVFRTPEHGVFGSNQHYTIEDVRQETLPREEVHYPGGERYDEEEDRTYIEEPYTRVKEAWEGVVIG